MGSVQQLRTEWNVLHSRQQQISDLFEGLLAKKNRQLSSRTVKLLPPKDPNATAKPRTSTGIVQKTAESKQRLSALASSHEKLSQTLASVKAAESASPTPAPKSTPVAPIVKVASTQEKEVLTDRTPQSTQLSQTEQPRTEHAESQTLQNKVTEVTTQTTIVAEEERIKEEANNKRKLHNVVDNVDELLLHLISSFKQVK